MKKAEMILKVIIIEFFLEFFVCHRLKVKAN